MNTNSYSAESIQQLLEIENINVTAPQDPTTQLGDLLATGSTVMIIDETSRYILTHKTSCNTDPFKSSNPFVNKILECYKLKAPNYGPLYVQDETDILSIENALHNFFDTEMDFLYFSRNNALISLNDNITTAHKLAKQTICQLESRWALEKTNHAKKDQMVRALKYDLREYKVALYIPGMSWIGKLGKLIEPRLGNLYQYHPRALAVPKHPSIKLAHFPKISIVTPSFEQGRYLEKTLQSVLDQNYSNLEYIVKDGGSRDNSRDILRSYEDRLTHWISEPDSGQSQAINLGFARATGEIMAWLNSDDLLLPEALTYVANYFNNHPDVDVIYGNRLLIDENDMEIGRWILPGHSNATLSWADFIPQETMFWRRRIWNKIGGNIDETFRFAMDWDLLIRFREAGAQFAHVPHFLGAFRVHESQKTSAATDIGSKETARIRKRIFGKIPARIKVRLALAPFILRHIAVNFIYLITSRLNRKKYKLVFSKQEPFELDV